MSSFNLNHLIIDPISTYAILGARASIHEFDEEEKFSP